MKRNQDDIDNNIRESPLKLSWPLDAKNDRQIRIRESTSREAAVDHISAKRHHLKVDDIKRLATILKNPKFCHIDSHNKHYRVYYGARKGNKNPAMLKVVTEIDKNDPKKEWIVTIYPTKKVK